MKSTKSNKNLKRTTILMDKNLYKKLRMFAIESDKTVAECINEAIASYLKKHRK